MLNHFSRRVLTGFLAMAIAGGGVAFAQDEEASEEMVEEGGDESGGDESGDSAAAADISATAPASAGGYPIEVLSRPLVLPKGVWEAGADTEFINAEELVVGSAVGFNYGVVDKVQVGAAYAFLLKEFEAKGAVAVTASYYVMPEGTLKVRGDAFLAYNLLAEDIGPINAGALIKYELSPIMAVFTRPALVVDNKEEDLVGGGETRPISAEIPAAFAYQVAPNIFAQASVNLAVLKVKDSANAFIFSDFIPVEVMASYSLSNMIDVGASFAADFKSDAIGDTIVVGALARYRGGL